MLLQKQDTPYFSYKVEFTPSNIQLQSKGKTEDIVERESLVYCLAGNIKVTGAEFPNKACGLYQMAMTMREMIGETLTDENMEANL